ncbi:hypothetical protein [Flavobacterium soyangense]|uniref:Carboxypeptidase-like regulatory domain-containing protein n=1 Tax=Flavobacterium soyangense TaxID=2023265 RepID=A0A930UB71_9FLAO|nr:hypothetical protein [Flavobacterium soyangense]MBF2710016.1 hypothetical protein [Flavobacterium soyangense]
MKTKIGILALCLFYQFCIGQTLTRKPLHGLVLNDSVNVESGYVYNVNSKARTFISSKGFFDILAKTNDTLLISSLGLKSKRIVLTEKDFAPSLLVIRLNVFVNQLQEIVVKKIVIKPNLGNIQSIIDTQYFEDKQSSLKNPLMPYHDIVYGIDFIRVGKMIWKIFVKGSTDKTKAAAYGDFSEVVPKRISPFFFTNTLQLKEDEIGLFLIYCENDPKAKELLNPNLEFELIEFLITKNEEFKRFTTFEN